MQIYSIFSLPWNFGAIKIHCLLLVGMQVEIVNRLKFLISFLVFKSFGYGQQIF